MENLPSEIDDFLQAQNVASISFVDETSLVPYSFSCFYAFDKKHMLLMFKSSRDTWHAGHLDPGKAIAGTILPDKLDVIRLQGIQLAGHILAQDDHLHKYAVGVYYKRFPFARIMNGEIWAVQLHSIKMTDNKKGFGKKIKWELNKVA